MSPISKLNYLRGSCHRHCSGSEEGILPTSLNITVCPVTLILYRNGDTLTQSTRELTHNISFCLLLNPNMHREMPFGKRQLVTQWEDYLLGQSHQGTDSRGMTIPWVNLIYLKGGLNIVNTWTFGNCSPTKVKRTQFCNYTHTKNTTHRVYNKIFGLNSKSKVSPNKCVLLTKLFDIVKWIHISGGKKKDQIKHDLNAIQKYLETSTSSYRTYCFKPPTLLWVENCTKLAIFKTVREESCKNHKN